MGPAQFGVVKCRGSTIAPAPKTSLLALLFSYAYLKERFVVHLSAFFFFLLELELVGADPVQGQGPVLVVWARTFFIGPEKTLERSREPKKGIEPLFYRHEWYVLTI